MLKVLIVKNFQRVKKIKIKFHKNVTVLVGDNDLGKSTVARALRWVALNKPSGKRVINWDAKKADVTLVTDKHTIQRIISKSQNEYIFDGHKYKSFRTGVPEPIANALKLQDINFQRQHESAFWFSLGPTQVTKELNKLTDLATIDALQTHLNKQLRESNALLLATKKRITSERELCHSLQWARRLWGRFRPLSPQLGGVARIRSHLRRVALLLGGAMAHASTRQRSCGAIVGAAAGAAAAGRCRGAAGLLSTLAGLLGAAGAAGGLLADDPPPTPPTPPPQSLLDAVSGIDELTEMLKKQNEEINRKKKQLQKELANKCPVCGSSFTPE